MVRTALLFLLTLSVAICVGAASVALVIERDVRLGGIRVGPWMAYPESGAGSADPYARAEAAVEGTLALGRSEGLSFFAEHDEAGSDLLAECTYRLTGETPLARLWTLRSEPYDRAVSNRLTGAPAHGTLHSRAVLRNADNSITITAGAAPAPGNWLRTEGTGRMRLVLTLYDALVQGGPMSETMKMPTVRQVACDG
ncbi:MAG: DUF1214 domain-containing protein [Rhizobiaceae bacterium]|nr:DUF1214 domain-containing protein [Rhizobiaceae bacterium]